MDNKPKNAIFLSGGGAMGSFHIGFFQALKNQDIGYDTIFGCSAGAIVGSAATYMSPDEMLKIWESLSFENVLNIDSSKIKNFNGNHLILEKFLNLDSKTIKNYERIRRNIHLLNQCGKSCFKKFPHLLIDFDNFSNLISSNVNGECVLSSSVNFGISTTAIPSCKMVNVWKKDMITDPMEYVKASAHLPALRRKRLIDNKNYLDWCRFRRYPFEVFDEIDFDNLIIVNTEAEKINKRFINPIDEHFGKDIFKIYYYDGKISISIVPKEKDDYLDSCKKIIFINNDNKASILDFDKDQIKKNYDMGLKTSEDVLKTVKKLTRKI